MILLYAVLFAVVIGVVIHMRRYIKNDSPELKREDAAYRKLMDLLTDEASEILGRKITEKDILDAGRRLGKRR